MKKIRFVLLGLFLAASVFTSCKSEITITQNKDNSVDVKFNAAAGEAFTKMVTAAAGEDGTISFDLPAITKELEKSGFANIKLETKNVIDVDASMTDFIGESILFTSGLLKSDKNGLSVNLTRDKFADFYNSADDDLLMILDMFLSPVFNDEEMTETEYLETLASFYGKEAAKEIKNSNLKINLENVDGKKLSKTVSLAKLFTLNEPIVIQ